VPAACFRWRELSDVDHSACSSSKGVVCLDETLQRLELWGGQSTAISPPPHSFKHRIPVLSRYLVQLGEANG
jgi:hypothetical protein